MEMLGYPKRRIYKRLIKKKFSRILGVGLSLMLLASLMVVMAPASASSLSWGAEKDPSDLVDNTLAPSGMGIVDMAVNGDTIRSYFHSQAAREVVNCCLGGTITNLGGADDNPGNR